MNIYVLYKAPWQNDHYTGLAIYKLVCRAELEWEFICSAGSQLAKEMGGYNTFQFVKFKPYKLKIHDHYCDFGGNLIHRYSLQFNPSQIQ